MGKYKRWAKKKGDKKGKENEKGAYNRDRQQASQGPRRERAKLAMENEGENSQPGQEESLEDFIRRFTGAIVTDHENGEGVNGSYEYAHMASDSSSALTVSRPVPKSVVPLRMDTECTFTLLPLSVVSPYIIKRWPYVSRYSEAFGKQEGGGTVTTERALVLLEVPLFSGRTAVVPIVGNLTDHPGVTDVLSSTPHVDRFSGRAALPTATGEVI
uniref:Uncharacterized protein n=1 Tax=Chromera velia CCMP2878 TaxID=1169474 RepID=A0A0G4HLE7_9ALVE|eukprot:Cvel_28723.t1-p1 / transcript=Cvel_28723.t1 / gene=Cvel_28723 / organism=Chromera_velia_CCMP2878 / gene_product=hypothetical protein / transcript_product=hypothetical protein / location=Cvel_scaffold3812:11516-12154(+) / protein_length=213 / sequence_SO=supercontig / SO=protein_coding / is_pseudo=false